MNKVYKYLVPAFIILVFIGVMTSHIFLKRPLGETDDVESFIAALRTDLVKEDWLNAEKHLSDLQRGWCIVVRRVQFSVERDEINLLNANLARISGFLLARDKAGALAELAEAEEHWNYLGR